MCLTLGMGNSAVSKSKRRLSDLTDVPADVKARESYMRERILRGECDDSGLCTAPSRDCNSSFSASSEYLTPEPAVSFYCYCFH